MSPLSCREAKDFLMDRSLGVFLIMGINPLLGVSKPELNSPPLYSMIPPVSLWCTCALWALHNICGTSRRRLHLGSALVIEFDVLGEWQTTVLRKPWEPDMSFVRTSGPADSILFLERTCVFSFFFFFFKFIFIFSLGKEILSLSFMLISSLKLSMVTLWPLDFYLSNRHTRTDTGKHTHTGNIYWCRYMAHFNKSP